MSKRVSSMLALVPVAALSLAASHTTPIKIGANCP